MTNNINNYWVNEINSYRCQLHTGPDKKHNSYKWREVIKIARIMNAEINCKKRMESADNG